MNRALSFHNDQPTLYLIATPIGNLEDVSFRALRIIKEVDLLFAEDTRVTKKLLVRHQIERPLLSYHDHNKDLMGPTAMEAFLAGKSIGLVSDAGTPLVNDPGYELVQLARKHHYNVVAIPGPSAVLTALSISGLPPHPFVFYGFLPPAKQKREAEIARYADRPETLVFYESPHRMQDTLHELARLLGDRDAFVGRELTKLYEESIQGTLLELATISEWIGELVLVVGPPKASSHVPTLQSIPEDVDARMAQGMRKSDAMKEVAKERGLTKSVVYREYLSRHPDTKEEE